MKSLRNRRASPHQFVRLALSSFACSMNRIPHIRGEVRSCEAPENLPDVLRNLCALNEKRPEVIAQA
jgi:hypothetical protein